MSEENGAENKSLEDVLNEMHGKKARPKLDYTKYAPIGWQRLTDEQRKTLQDMIDRFIELNKEKSRQA